MLLNPLWAKVLTDINDRIFKEKKKQKKKTIRYGLRP